MASSPALIERRNRMIVLIGAWLYENNTSTGGFSDYFWDEIALSINPEISQGTSGQADEWFKTEYDPCTGQWIHNYPYPSIIETQFLYLKNSRKITKKSGYYQIAWERHPGTTKSLDRKRWDERLAC